MITQSIVLIDNTRPAPPMTTNQVRRVGQLITRLDEADIKCILGMLDDEPTFVLFFAGACTPLMGLAATERLIDLIETEGAL